MTKFELIVFTIGVILWFIYVIWSLKKGVNPFTIWEEEKDENAQRRENKTMFILRALASIVGAIIGLFGALLGHK